MSKRELIDIRTPNKDVVASFIYSWARQKDMSILEQRVVLRIIERASMKLKGVKIREYMCQLDLDEERDADDACLGGAVQHEDEAQGHRAGTVQPAQQDVRV